MKLRRAQGRRRARRSTIWTAHGRARRAGRPRGARRPRHGVGGLLDRLVGVFGRDRHLYVELQRHAGAMKRPTTRRWSIWRRRFACRSWRPTASASRRPTSGRCSTCSPAFTTIPIWPGAGRRLAPNAERYLKAPAEMAALFRRRVRRGRADRASWPIGCSTRWRISAIGFRTIRCRLAKPRRRFCGRSPTSARATATVRITIAPARRSRASSISSRSSISPATSSSSGTSSISAGSTTFSCRAAGRRPTAPSATAWASRPSIRSAWICCSSGFCRKSAASGPTSISICRAAIAASRSSSTCTRNTAGSAPAMTANVITYRGRSAAREVGKALGIEAAQIDRLARVMNQLRVPGSRRHAAAPPRRGRPRSRLGPRAALRRACGTRCRICRAISVSIPAAWSSVRVTSTRRPARERQHARPRRRAVGQGRLRRHGHRQGRSARPRHDGGAAGRACAESIRTARDRTLASLATVATSQPRSLPPS